jgi:hypothetical protein
MPWLEAWNPHLDFIKKTMIFWGSKARRSYERIKLESPEAFAHSMLTSMTDVYALYAGSVQDGQSETKGLPSCYAGKAVAFSEGDASILPDHGPHELSIDLEEGKVPPYGPLYNLSGTEMEILREYIRKNLARGWIRRSMSQSGAPILFTKKKDGALRLCVDYRGLNAITIKNRHPLPLIQESLDRLGHARVYMKLDLRDAYHRI